MNNLPLLSTAVERRMRGEDRMWREKLKGRMAALTTDWTRIFLHHQSSDSLNSSDTTSA